MEKLLTAKEIASGIGIHVETLYQWVKQDRISYVPLGREIMFGLAAIQEYLNKLECPPEVSIEFAADPSP